MITLGIDPGIELTGFGFVETSEGQQQLRECGVIRTPSTHSLEDRLMMIHQDLSQLIGKYDHIESCGVEELFFAKNVKTAASVWQARGVILFTLAQFGITIHHIKPLEVKSIVVGTATAKKAEVQKMVQLLFKLPEPPQPDDAADAVAIAIAAASIHNDRTK